MTDFWRITGLALADSVNPCEIALLAMVLMTIMIQNPEKKRKVLYAGAAFISAVFIGYLFYGLVLVQVFNSIAEVIRSNSFYIYNGLAILTMILGALNVKDYFYYKKGSFATEMPIFLRPKAKRWIERMTSAKGAFLIGFIVTIFLLPCTAGPLLVATGLLSDLGLLGALPWLIYYDLVFLLPMIVIVFIVYFGFAKVDEVTGWKDKHIRRLHLIAGVLLFLTGLAILMKWI